MREKQGTPNFPPRYLSALCGFRFSLICRRGHQVVQRTSFASCFLGLVILFCLGCAGHPVTSRVVQQESSWFVRLDTFQETRDSSLRYDHPKAWKDAELSAILSQLLLQERVGLMDNARPPRSVFSLEELNLLVPAVRQSFQEARSREWIVFTLVGTEGSGHETTSGGMFIEEGQLHLVIANHRLPLGEKLEELARVRANPLYSVQGSGGALAFDSPRFVIGTKANWSGGHRASASELILDYTGFLSSLQRRGSAAASLQMVGSPASASTPEFEAFHPGPSTSGEVDSEGIILRLQEEIEQLKQQLAEKDAALNRLKRREIRRLPVP